MTINGGKPANVKGVNKMQYFDYKGNCSIVDEIYDVVVVGGGTAGSTAAIASAREGAKTLIVERNTYLGGSAAGAQVTPMMHAGIIGNSDSSYINKFIKKKLKEENYGASDPYENDGWFNPEMLKFILEEEYISSGGRTLYDTEFIDSEVEDGEIKGIIVHNRGGLLKIRGNVFIDCTGDAELSFKSGVKCFKGSEKSGENQAVSLRFILGNIDLKHLIDFLKAIHEPMCLNYPLVEIAAIPSWDRPLSNIFKKAVEDNKLLKEDIAYFQGFSIPGMEGAMSFNCPEIPYITDSMDPFKLSAAEVTGRNMIRRIYKFLKEDITGFENSYILAVAPMIGIRESRRIKGKYILTEQDYKNKSKFEDAIARTAYPVDVHGDEEKGISLEPLKRGEYFEIPFRSLVPEKINNLLVGGRCISSSFIAQSSIRIQPTCRATGEACGIAGAICAKEGIKAAQLDGSLVRKLMIEKGSIL